MNAILNIKGINTNNIQDVNWFWTDTTFICVFERRIIYKESNQLNKEIPLNEGWKFLVKSVFENIPENSHIKVDVLGSYRSSFYVHEQLQQCDPNTGRESGVELPKGFALQPLDLEFTHSTQVSFRYQARPKNRNSNCLIDRASGDEKSWLAAQPREKPHFGYFVHGDC